MIGVLGDLAVLSVATRRISDHCTVACIGEVSLRSEPLRSLAKRISQK
jgi:hypothetical protein